MEVEKKPHLKGCGSIFGVSLRCVESFAPLAFAIPLFPIVIRPQEERGNDDREAENN
jgi:hypothetical protein